MIWSSVGRELSCSFAGGAEAASDSWAGFEDPCPVADVEDTEGLGTGLLDSVASAQLSVGLTSPVECCSCDSAPSTWCSEACTCPSDLCAFQTRLTMQLQTHFGSAEVASVKLAGNLLRPAVTLQRGEYVRGQSTWSRADTRSWEARLSLAILHITKDIA